MSYDFKNEVGTIREMRTILDNLQKKVNSLPDLQVSNGAQMFIWKYLPENNCKKNNRNDAYFLLTLGRSWLGTALGACKEENPYKPVADVSIIPVATDTDQYAVDVTTPEWGTNHHLEQINAIRLDLGTTRDIISNLKKSIAIAEIPDSEDLIDALIESLKRLREASFILGEELGLIRQYYSYLETITPKEIFVGTGGDMDIDSLKEGPSSKIEKISINDPVKVVTNPTDAMMRTKLAEENGNPL